MTDPKRRKGTRCAVCVMCGKCFDGKSEDLSLADTKWSGTRCEVCISCGKCAEAWGLVKRDDTDTESGPTDWASAFKVMDTGSGGTPPPLNGVPGASSRISLEDEITNSENADSKNENGEKCVCEKESVKEGKLSSFACLKRGADDEDLDTSTGATPGVSSACKEYGFDDMEKFIADLGIKPPGVA